MSSQLLAQAIRHWDGDHQDVEQAVLDLAGAARVLDLVEILRQALDRHAPLPRLCEHASSRVSAQQAREISCVAPVLSPYLPLPVKVTMPCQALRHLL